MLISSSLIPWSGVCYLFAEGFIVALDSIQATVFPFVYVYVFFGCISYKIFLTSDQRICCCLPEYKNQMSINDNKTIRWLMKDLHFYSINFALHWINYIILRAAVKIASHAVKKPKRRALRLFYYVFSFFILYCSNHSFQLHYMWRHRWLFLFWKKKNSNKNNTNKKNGKSLPGVSKSSRFSFSNTIRRVLASNNFNVFIPVIYFFCLSPNKKACFSIHFSGCYSIDIFCKIHSWNC